MLVHCDEVAQFDSLVCQFKLQVADHERGAQSVRTVNNAYMSPILCAISYKMHGVCCHQFSPDICPWSSQRRRGHEECPQI